MMIINLVNGFIEILSLSGIGWSINPPVIKRSSSLINFILKDPIIMLIMLQSLLCFILA